MLRKGAISQIDHTLGEFISSLFLVDKKGGGQLPVINLKNLIFFVPYEHFKMESLNLLQFLLKKGDYMSKLDLKDAYFCVPLHKESRKFVRFQWDGKLYEFLCPCFGLGPAPLIFTKLFKVPLAVLRRLNMLIIIYIDDMLIIDRIRNEVKSTRDTLIYLLQHLGFLLNLKKSVLQLCKFCESNSFTALTQGAEGPGGVHKDVQQELDIDFGTDQTFWSLVVNHPACCTSSLTNSESSTVTDIASEIEEIVSNECKIDNLSERGTALVDVELTTFKWEALHRGSSIPGVDLCRCLKKGMGSGVQGSSN